MDLMHQDFGGGDARMAAGQCKSGLNPSWAKTWGVTGQSPGFAASQANWHACYQ